tara:strand:+ start:1072 stop:1197 length:126 start_codon:yes stop_codon:yes gene_type:complete
MIDMAALLCDATCDGVGRLRGYASSSTNRTIFALGWTEAKL